MISKVFQARSTFELEESINRWMETEVGRKITPVHSSTTPIILQEDGRIRGIEYLHILYYMSEETILVTCTTCKGTKIYKGLGGDESHECHKCHGTGEMPVPKSIADYFRNKLAK